MDTNISKNDNNKDKYIFTVNLHMVTKNGNIAKFIQQQVFKQTTKYLFKDTDQNVKNWNQEQWNDPFKQLCHEGTLEECKVLRQKWENLPQNEVDHLLMNLKKNKFWRGFPLKLRSKLREIKLDEAFSPWNKLVFLMQLFGILLYTDIQKQ